MFCHFSCVRVTHLNSFCLIGQLAFQLEDLIGRGLLNFLQCELKPLDVFEKAEDFAVFGQQSSLQLGGQHLSLLILLLTGREEDATKGVRRKESDERIDEWRKRTSL